MAAYGQGHGYKRIIHREINNIKEGSSRFVTSCLHSHEELIPTLMESLYWPIEEDYVFKKLSKIRL